MNLAHPPGATPLDPDEQAGLIPSSISTQGDLDAFEQANIVRAQEWALGRAHKADLLRIPFLRDLHRRMFDEVWKWAGRFRVSDKNIGVAWSGIPSELRQLCDDARYWIEHATFPWDELGARFHHRLVAIHPFSNGNGRHARLMTDVLLRANGQTLFSWGSESLVRPGDTRQRYIDALKAADARQYDALVAFVRA